MTARKRGILDFFVDRFVGWWCGLPGESCSYSVTPLRIPLTQDIKLAANLYRPTIPKPHGTILVRTSYGIAPLMALGSARMFAPRGYQVLLCACRGTDPSDGQELTFGVHEAADGAKTVEWIRDQPWYTGWFGTFGGSYLGYTQWALLTNPPHDMKAASHMVAWADLMTAPKRGLTPGPAQIKKQPEILQQVCSGVPLVDALDKHFEGHTPGWLTFAATHPDRQGPWYESLSQRAALEKAKIPILQITGWDDVALPWSTEQHETLSKHGGKAFMTMGPWSHLGCQRAPSIAEGFQFLEQNLAGRGKDFRDSTVRVFVTGSKIWKELPEWPPVPTSTEKFYLTAEKTLSPTPPDAENEASKFKFDPKNPTPNIGLPRPFDDMIPASYTDTTLASRPDVLVFTTPPLDRDLQVLGSPTIHLYHSTSSPNADLSIQLREVDSRGTSRRISNVYQRLPSKRERMLEFRLSACAHTFCRGKRIRVLVAGGAHPAYVRNLGTGENPGLGREMREVWHEVGAASRVVLPVVG